MALGWGRNSRSRTWQAIKRAEGSSTSIASDMRVDFGRSNVAMPENFLNRHTLGDSRGQNGLPQPNTFYLKILMS